MLIRSVPLSLLVGCTSPTVDVSSAGTGPSNEILGHRFRIVASPGAVGKSDTLVEHFCSGHDHLEVAKYVSNFSYDGLVSRAYRLDPEIFVTSTNNELDTLFIRKGGGAFGLALLLNEGDLDGDGRDEIGYVVDNADWSNTNTYVVVSYRNDAWTELFRFAIWEWQLPDLPDTEREYGLIGQTGRHVHEVDGSMSSVDLVLPVHPGLVKVIGNIGDATLDTMELTFPPASVNGRNS